MKKSVKKRPFFVVFFDVGMTVLKSVKNGADFGMGLFIKARSLPENGTVIFFSYQTNGERGTAPHKRHVNGRFLGLSCS